MMLINFIRFHNLEYYGTFAYYLSDTILDLLWLFIDAIIYAMMTYYFTNQPRRFLRFMVYFTIIYLTTILFTAMGQMIALLFYPFSTLGLSVGFFCPSYFIHFTNFTIVESEQIFPFNYMTRFCPLQPLINSMVISIYGLDRCPPITISPRLVSYKMNETHSLLSQIIHIFIHIIIYKLICLLIMLYKSKMTMLIVKVIRKNYFGKNEENYHDIISPNTLKNVENYDMIYEIINNKSEHRDLNIAWTNLTVKVSKSMFRCEKVILNDINGLVEFGTMMALMGPSGAGKSTLLRALMGINKKLITKESNIYCNKSIEMKSCFIAQDVRQHIISGLTVGQSLFYASKLKNLSNTGLNIDNREAIDTLMRDFAIEDIKDINIDKCSSGQQKRCVLAMVLCAQQKPTVVFVDEPTSGVDSHTSLTVNKYL